MLMWRKSEIQNIVHHSQNQPNHNHDDTYCTTHELSRARHMHMKADLTMLKLDTGQVSHVQTQDVRCMI